MKNLLTIVCSVLALSLSVAHSALATIHTIEILNPIQLEEPELMKVFIYKIDIQRGAIVSTSLHADQNATTCRILSNSAVIPTGTYQAQVLHPVAPSDLTLTMTFNIDSAGDPYGFTELFCYQVATASNPFDQGVSDALQGLAIIR